MRMGDTLTENKTRNHQLFVVHSSLYHTPKPILAKPENQKCIVLKKKLQSSNILVHVHIQKHFFGFLKLHM